MGPTKLPKEQMQKRSDDEQIRRSNMWPRSIEEMETFKKLVAKAAEFDATRGDQLEVANVQFSDEDTEVGRGPAASPSFEMRFVFGREWVSCLLLALLVFLVFRPMVRTLTEQPELAEVLDGQLPGTDDAALPGEEIFDESEYEMVPIAEKIVAYCKANPQTAADVLTHWLRGYSGASGITKQASTEYEDVELEESAA